MKKLFCSNGFLILLFYFLLPSCSTQKNISRSAKQLIKDSSTINAHIGISIYDPSTGKYLYNYQGDKYFVPASNTKLFTCYAAMKYLGDSLKGMKYFISDGPELNRIIVVEPTGDPTFLHPDFKKHPVFDFLKNTKSFGICDATTGWREQALGYGWAWNDYNDDYMAERNPFPIYGNVMTITTNELKEERKFKVVPAIFDSVLNADFNYSGYFSDTPKIDIIRKLSENSFQFEPRKTKFIRASIPFVTGISFTAFNILSDSLKKERFWIQQRVTDDPVPYLRLTCPGCQLLHINIKPWQIIYSQPTDSVLRPMMHRSDNFFAEQMLLMVSNEKLGYMNDAAIIDTILKTDLALAPQKPKWVDGCGLSRYNLFSPNDFVYILNKMKAEFGMPKLQNILATGGQGTISSYYQNMAGQIYAKTGTLSNNCALSGFLTAKSGKLLIFSILANNYQGAATPVRRAVERFLNKVRDNY